MDLFGWSNTSSFFLEYPSLIGLFHITRNESDQPKFPDLLRRLSNLETLLTLAALLPMLEEMRNIMKATQKRALYIAEYAMMHKMTCMNLSNIY